LGKVNYSQTFKQKLLLPVKSAWPPHIISTFPITFSSPLTSAFSHILEHTKFQLKATVLTLPLLWCPSPESHTAADCSPN
jgi:hypothetical protein